MGCGLFFFVSTLSGIVLVFSGEVDRALHPTLYAVTGPAMAQPAEVYLARAKAALRNGEATQLRWPREPGLPVTVLVRLGGGSGRPDRELATETASPSAARPGQSGGERNAAASGGAAPGARPRMLTVYLDPPTGEVLGTADPRASFVGLVHALHEELLVPAFGGRQIVGSYGAGLFILCLTGLYLWWPRNAGFLRGLGWSRGPATSVNLHHRIGFWIVVPLAVMAFTGMFQAFQQPGRAVIGFFAPVTPQPMRQGFGTAPPKTNLEPQQVLDLAKAGAADVQPVLLALPSEANKTWRVQLAGAKGETKTVLVDDTSKAVSMPQPLQGDAFLAFMRRIHEAKHDGPIWKTIVILTALSPPVLFVTGVMMWLRRRRYAKALAARSGKPATIASGPTQTLDQDHIAA